MNDRNARMPSKKYKIYPEIVGFLTQLLFSKTLPIQLNSIIHLPFQIKVFPETILKLLSCKCIPQ